VTNSRTQDCRNGLLLVRLRARQWPAATAALTALKAVKARLVVSSSAKHIHRTAYAFASHQGLGDADAASPAVHLGQLLGVPALEPPPSAAFAAIEATT
jgi:hypothetical protein